MDEKKEKLYEVFTPVKTFSGYRYGVLFKDGKGMANKHQAEVLVGNFGYHCPALKKEKAQQAETKNSEETEPETDKKTKKNK